MRKIIGVTLAAFAALLCLTACQVGKPKANLQGGAASVPTLACRADHMVCTVTYKGTRYTMADVEAKTTRKEQNGIAGSQTGGAGPLMKCSDICVIDVASFERGWDIVCAPDSGALSCTDELLTP